MLLQTCNESEEVEIEVISNPTARNGMWQNIWRKEEGGCLRPKGENDVRNHVASKHAPGGKYMHFAGKVPSAVLSIPTSEPLLIP